LSAAFQPASLRNIGHHLPEVLLYAAAVLVFWDGLGCFGRARSASAVSCSGSARGPVSAIGSPSPSDLLFWRDALPFSGDFCYGIYNTRKLLINRDDW
jgi:hypothetical protein